MEKVFNLGFSKTGTTSFEYAVEYLGYNTYHGNYTLKHSDYMLALWIHRDFDEIRKMTAYWDAYADAPWGGTDLYLKLIEWYPEAKFVHTLRDADSWYASLEKMLMRFDTNPEKAIDMFHVNGRFGFSYFMKHNFGIENLSGAKQKIIDQYNRHNDQVTEFMLKKNAAYLPFKSVDGEGWEKLCPFLGKPIPEIAYPHHNPAVGTEQKVQPQTKPEVNSNLGGRIINKIKKILPP